MYVIKRNSDGKYVAKPGSAKSYTAKLEKAQTFTTEQAARASACGNEHVINVWAGER